MTRESFRSGFQDRMEGAILLGLGGSMVEPALATRLYRNLLNPKFEPLTLCAGALLGLCGLALLLRPEHGHGTTPRLFRQAVMLAFLCIAATAWDHMLRPPQSAGAPRTQARAAEAPIPASPVRAAEPVPARPADQAAIPTEGPALTVDGVRYVRLNIAELAMLLDKKNARAPERFAIRARLTRPARLGGTSLLARTAIVCCLADSLDVGFLARGLDGIPTGRWVEVCGRLAPLSAAERLKAKAGAPNGEAAFQVIDRARGVVAEHVRLIPEPDPPFLYEFHDAEPFAWR